MEELLRKLEDQLVTHLWDIERSVAENDGFRCHQQVDDVKDCLSAIRDIANIRLVGVK